jgi:hypothetical protein
MNIFGPQPGPIPLVELDQNFAELDADIAALGGGTGASSVGFQQSGTGAVSTTVAGELARILTPEQFGAIGNANFYKSTAPTGWFSDAAFTIPANNDTAAFKAMYDELNKRGGGIVECNPDAHYWWNNVLYNPTFTFPFITTTRYDGRATTAPFYGAKLGTGNEALNDPAGANDVPFLLGLSAFEFRGNGCTIICKGDFRLEIGQNPANGNHKSSIIPFSMAYCNNVYIHDVNLTGEWSKTIISKDARAQDVGSAISYRATKGLYLRNVTTDDFSMDGLVGDHLFVNPSNDMEGAFTPEQFDDTHFQPSGESRNIVLAHDCNITFSGRNGLSPTGQNGWRMYGGSIHDTGNQRSTLPMAFTGSVAGSYSSNPVNPGNAFDFEPNRNSPHMIDDIKFFDVRIYNNRAGIGSVLGDAGRLKSAANFATTDVDVPNSQITVSSNHLSGVQFLNHVRFATTNTLPAPLQPSTNYWLIKAINATTFKVAYTYEDGLAGTFIPLTDVGIGTHSIAIHDTIDCGTNIDLIDCELDHPPEASGLIFNGASTRWRINGGYLKIRYYNPTLGLGTGTGRSDFLVDDVDITFSRSIGSGLMQVSTGLGVFGTLTGALPGIVDVGANTINLPAHALSRWEFNAVFVTATTLPAPLEFGETYYVIPVDVDHISLAYTADLAAAGTAIDLTTQGTGTLTVRALNGSRWWFDRNRISQYFRPNKIIPQNVDTATDYIHVQDHDLGQGEGIRLATTGGLPAPLVATVLGTAGTTYFVIRNAFDNTKFRLATTLNNANAGVAIDLTTQGTGVQTILPTSTAIVTLDGPAIKFTRNSVIAKDFAHANAAAIQTAANFMRLEKGGIHDNIYETNLVTQSGLSWRISLTDMVNTVHYRERYRTGFVASYSGVLPTLFEADTRIYTATVNWTPGAVNANTSAEQTITVTGLKTTDQINITPPGATAGLVLGGARASTTDTLSVRWGNVTAGPLTPAAGNYLISVVRQGN